MDSIVMRKFILISGSLVVILVLGLLAIPYFFKDQLKAKILTEIDHQLNADINFTDVKISSFSNFPHIGLAFSNFSIKGKEAFVTDTLATAKQLTLSFDLQSVWEGKEIEIKSIHLQSPVIKIRVLKDGSSNYDLLQTDSTAQKKSIKINIELWDILNGELFYNNQQQATLIGMKGINHSGSGDFDNEISDLNITTSVEELSYTFQGIKYLDKKHFVTDLIMEMNLKEWLFTFKDHNLELNHFKISFDGNFKILKQGFEINLGFSVKETDFKNLLSILPRFYKDDFKNIKTKGEFELNGFVKGTYNQVTNQVPNFLIDLKVLDGFFQYSHLPKPVENIFLHLTLQNTNQAIETTVLNVRNFHLDLDKNPIEGKVKITGLTHPHFNTEIKANLDLADLEKMFPIPDFILRGKLDVDIKANGVWNDSLKFFPIVDAHLVLDSGYIQYKKYPLPLEKIKINAEVINLSGKLAETTINLQQMTYQLEGEPFSLSGKISNLVDYQYDLKVDGEIDLEKITQIYPVVDMKLKGLVDFDFETNGKLIDLEANRFNLISNNGKIELKNLFIQLADNKKEISIQSGTINFQPDRLSIEQLKMKVGKSTISLSGHLFDYWSTIANTGRYLQGDLKMECDTLDINEWMQNNQAKAKPDTTISKLRVVEIPRQIDFTFDSKIDFVRFGELKINDLEGEIKIKDGILSLKETGFNAVDAKFSITGDYNTQNMEHPAFDLAFNIEKLDMQKAYAVFSTIKTMAPIAENTQGTFSSNYKLKGELADNFTPIFKTIVGGGIVKIENAELKGMKVMSHISNITNKKEMTDPTIKDIVMTSEIKGGKVFVNPFTFQLGKYITSLEGSHSFENEINYLLKISVPPFNKIRIPFHVTGTVDKPVVRLGKGHEEYDFSKME